MKLNQITVPSINVENAIAFYEKLGLKLIVRALPKYARFEFPEGGSSFSIHQVDQLPQGEGVIIYFEYDDLDLEVEQLVAKGIVFDQMPEDMTPLENLKPQFFITFS